MTSRYNKKVRARERMVSRLVVCGLTAMVLGACAGHDDEGGSDKVTTGDVAIAFSTDMDDTATRATTGIIGSVDDMKQSGYEGFGVLAYFTGTDDQPSRTWAEATSGQVSDDGTALSTYPTPDFMYNQPVTWGVRSVERDANGEVKRDDDGKPIAYYGWVYEPLKYWPNSTDNATPRHISFFAYAPHTEITNSSTGETGETTGITAMTCDADHRPYVDYVLDDAGSQVDLLWGNAIDATRNGQGLIQVAGNQKSYEQVPLTFHHALSRVDFYVLRNFDETVTSGKKPADAAHTRVYVSRLTLDAGTNGFKQKGRLNLETGQWSNLADAGGTPLTAQTYGTTLFNDSLNGTVETTLPAITSYELNKWAYGYDAATDKWDDTNLSGVTDQERQLFADGTTLFFLPQEFTLTPTLTYSLVTRDDELLLSTITDADGHHYSRIVNTITGNSIKLNLEGGKRYRLVLRIGVESVQFEVTDIVDWDFPMRFHPVTEDYQEKNEPKTLNE